MDLKLVIFDMDGLMFDTEPLCGRCIAQAAINYGYTVDATLQLEMIGLNGHDHDQLMSGHFGLDYPSVQIRDEARKIRMDYLNEHGMTLKKGLKELIGYLKAQQLPIALASSSSMDTINTYLKLAKLEGVFDYIVGGNVVKHSKPNPEIFNLALTHFELNANQALVLEDSKNGILASHKAHIPVICVPDIKYHEASIMALTYKVLPDLIAVKDAIVNLLEC